MTAWGASRVQVSHRRPISVIITVMSLSQKQPVYHLRRAQPCVLTVVTTVDGRRLTSECQDTPRVRVFAENRGPTPAHRATAAGGSPRRGACANGFGKRRVQRWPLSFRGGHSASSTGTRRSASEGAVARRPPPTAAGAGGPGWEGCPPLHVKPGHPLGRWQRDSPECRSVMAVVAGKCQTTVCVLSRPANLHLVPSA